MSKIEHEIINHMLAVPASEFQPSFARMMVEAMMISYYKYGKLADAYPIKFNAMDDIRARLTKYRETGNKHYLVDIANFAMIEAMHPSLENSHWGTNDAADSPGRSKGRKLVQETNDGTRILQRDL